MEKRKNSSGELTSWGTSLLNKLSASARNNRKRDASKRRRVHDRDEIAQEIRTGLEGS